MALCPFADHELIPAGSNDPRITPRIAILHVAVSIVESLYRFFRYQSGGIESHFYVTLTGRLIQYRDTGWQADANHLANNFAVSIETAGFGKGRWNRRQRRTIERLLLWLHETHEIPLREVQHPTGSGVGFHVMFGAPGPWTPVAKSCPGPARIRQFREWLVPWMRAQRDRPASSTTRPTTTTTEGLEAMDEKELRRLFRQELRRATARPSWGAQWRSEALLREAVRLLGGRPAAVISAARKGRKKKGDKR